MCDRALSVRRHFPPGARFASSSPMGCQMERFARMTRDKDRMAGSSDRRLPILAGVAALCAVLLALSTNVASSLVPQEWAKHHAVWVWAATGVLAVTSVCLAMLASR